MIRVLLADDHNLVRAGLVRIVEASGGMKVVAEAADGQEAIRKVHQTRPDVAVMEISMPGMDGLEAVRRLRNAYPKLPILILTMHEEQQYAVRAIGAGANGYISKRSSPDQLVKAVHQIYAGRRYLSDAAVEALAQHMADGPRRRSPLDSLSNREIQVLRHLALGYTVREVAQAHNLSTNTVNCHRLRLLHKLNLRNNSELSLFAIQNHLVEL